MFYVSQYYNEYTPPTNGIFYMFIYWLAIGFHNEYNWNTVQFLLNNN
jgi:hypothetical protein